MPRALVHLTGSLTYTAMGHTFEKGKPKLLTNEGDIAYFSAQQGFTVTPVEEPKKVRAAAPPPPPPAEDGEDGDEPDDPGAVPPPPAPTPARGAARRRVPNK